MKRMLSGMAALALFVAGAPGANAQQHGSHGTHVAATAASTVMTAGEVRKVDAALGKVTIRHEPIANLDMPAMTMVFNADKAALKAVKPGDKVLFHAESADGALLVTKLQVQAPK